MHSRYHSCGRGWGDLQSRPLLVLPLLALLVLLRLQVSLLFVRLPLPGILLRALQFPLQPVHLPVSRARVRVLFSGRFLRLLQGHLRPHLHWR